MIMSINKLFLILFFVFIVLFAAKAMYLGKTVYGDGVYYYSWVRSLVVDHDLSFANDYQLLGGVQPTTPLGLIGNVYPIGPALFWLPFFLPLYNFLGGNGTSISYQMSVGLVSCLYTIAGLVLLYRLLLKYFPEEVSFLTTAAIGTGTNLLFYGSLDTVNSHSTSFFISVILLSLLLEKRSMFIIGFFTGLLSLMRTQDGIFAILATVFVLMEYDSHQLILKNLQQISKKMMGFFLGLGIAFSPQLFAWHVLYGTFLKSPYLDAYHYFDFIHPHYLEVLLSRNNGLFFWTPLSAIGVVGLFYRSQLGKRVQYIFLFQCVLQWLLISAWSFWWQGASYSGRMFISVLPLLAFGLANVLQRYLFLTRYTIVILFSCVNILAICIFLLQS